MSDYISREAAIRTVGEAERNNKSWNVALLNIPAADVRPVVRGKWRIIDIKNTKNGPVRTCECSECRFGATFTKGPNYCPNCGADMRGALMCAATETEGKDAEG